MTPWTHSCIGLLVVALVLASACSEEPPAAADAGERQDTLSPQDAPETRDTGARQDALDAPEPADDGGTQDTSTAIDAEDTADLTAEDTADLTAEDSDQADSPDATVETPRLLWIGAHPDDETTASPMLHEACNGPAECRFLVLTQGESGVCGLPEGCAPSLASVRAAELEASAALFGASLAHWDLGDSVQPTPDLVLDAWGARRGDLDTLVAEVRGEIEAFDPSLILTFDPRHGISCHQDHRAAATLVLMAAEQLGFAQENLWMMEGAPYLESEGGTPTLAYLTPMVVDDTAIREHDATQVTVASSGWEALVSVIEAHPSQFTPELADAFRAASADRQRAYYLPLSDALLGGDPRYDGLCP